MPFVLQLQSLRSRRQTDMTTKKEENEKNKKSSRKDEKKFLRGFMYENKRIKNILTETSCSIKLVRSDVLYIVTPLMV